MASNAISAQGSTLKIATGTGSAKNITGLALGNPTIITSAAHGFSNGDAVTIASVGGNTTLNGNNYIVKNKTTNTFALDVDTTGGSAYTSGGTAAPVTFTQIKEVKTYSGFDGQASELDVTNLDSSAKEFKLGLVDEGGFSFEMSQVNTDAGQTALRTSRGAGTLKQYILTLPNAETATFSAYAKALPTSGGVDGIVASSVALRISGSVVWA